MIISIDTKSTGKRQSKKRQELVQDAVAFFVDELLREAGVSQSIIVTVKLVEKLFEKYATKAIIELIETDDDTWEFEIKVDSSMKDYPLLVSLAHECVHLAQYYSGDLEELNQGTTRWMNEWYSLSKTKYWDRPWEIEAYGREMGLVEKFVTKFKQQNARWYLRDPDYL
jgi:hypothetical protein